MHSGLSMYATGEFGMMKNKINLLFCGILLIALLAGCSRNGEKSSNREAAGENGKAAGQAVPAQFAIEAFGVVRAPVRTAVTVEFPAIVQKVHAERGDVLPAGEEIITFNLREYRYELTNLETTLQTEELRLEKLRQELDRQDRQVEQDYQRLSNQIAVAEAELESLIERRWEQRSLLQENKDPEIEIGRADV